MQRVTRSTAVASMPAPPASPGSAGFFTGGDALANIPATIPGFEWFNGVQEEIVAAIQATGIVLDGAVLTQLRQSIRRLAAANVTAKSANAALTADEVGLVTVNAAGGNIVLTLPAANGANGAPLRYLFLRTDSSGNTVTVQRAGTDTIAGATSLSLPRGRPVPLIGDGASKWLFSGAQPGFGQRQNITATGSFTAPFDGWYFVRLVGGGGAGGGSTGTRNGGGGGAGEYAEGWHYLTAGQVVTVTIGAAGTGVLSADGLPGGTSSFGALMTAIGGYGGISQAGPFVAGGPGGFGGTGGQFRATGGAGQSGSNVAGSTTPGGCGGAGFFGGGGMSATVVANAVGQAPGSGGGGTYGANLAGGNGAAGICIVEW